MEVTTQRIDPSDSIQVITWENYPPDTVITLVLGNDEDACLATYFYLYQNYIIMDINKFYTLPYDVVKVNLYREDGEEILPTIDFPDKEKKKKEVWERAKTNILEKYQPAEEDSLLIRDMKQPYFSFD